MTVQLATRVNDEQAIKFRAYTSALGTTPSDALRIFIASFNQNKGFPYDVRLKEDATYVPFESEQEVDDFVTSLSSEMIKNAK